MRHDCPKAAPSAAEAVLQYNRAGGRTKSDALVKIMLMLLEGVCLEGKGSDCRNARTQDGCGRCKNIPNLHWVHVGVSEDSLTRKAAGAAIEASGQGPANQDLNTTALVAEAAALGEIVSAVGPTFDLVGLIDEVVSDVAGPAATDLPERGWAGADPDQKANTLRAILASLALDGSFGRCGRPASHRHGRSSRRSVPWQGGRSWCGSRRLMLRARAGRQLVHAPPRSTERPDKRPAGSAGLSARAETTNRWRVGRFGWRPAKSCCRRCGSGSCDRARKTIKRCVHAAASPRSLLPPHCCPSQTATPQPRRPGPSLRLTPPSSAPPPLSGLRAVGRTEVWRALRGFLLQGASVPSRSPLPSMHRVELTQQCCCRCAVVPQCGLR